MNYLKNLAEQDFCSQKSKDGNIEVLVKKLYEPFSDGYDPNKNEYICIRKDFLLTINDMFNDREQELNEYKKIVDKIRNIIIG
jgi:hypothetical protein